MVKRDKQEDFLGAIEKKLHGAKEETKKNISSRSRRSKCDLRRSFKILAQGALKTHSQYDV